MLKPLLLLLTLTACGLTPQGNLLRSAIATQGREAAATALENAEWAICRAMPVGAVMDRYGRSQSMADAWRTLCRSENDARLIKPDDQ